MKSCGRELFAPRFKYAVYHGDGLGGFHFQTRTPILANRCLTTADMNGDGLADLITETGVIVNLGDGRFSEPVHWAVPGWTAAAVAEFDGDGKPDILALSSADPGRVIHWRNAPR